MSEINLEQATINLNAAGHEAENALGELERGEGPPYNETAIYCRQGIDAFKRALEALGQPYAEACGAGGEGG